MALIANVTPGNIIDANAWGNPIRDRTCQVFASVTERDQQWPTGSAPDGAVCLTRDTYTVWKNLAGTGWRPVAPSTTSRNVANIGTNYDPTKPLDLFTSRFTSTTDASGFFTLDLTAFSIPRTPVALLGVHLMCEASATYAYVQMMVVQDQSTATSIRVRTFTVTGTAPATVNVQGSMSLLYQ